MPDCDPRTVYLLQRVGPHPLPCSLAQSWQARKSQTPQNPHLYSFLHCHQLIKSSECLSHDCQMSICLGLSRILLPCPVYNPHRAHNGPVSVWDHVEMCVYTSTPGSGGSLVLLLPLTHLLPCRLKEAQEPKECQGWCWRSGFILMLPLMISEPQRFHLQNGAITPTPPCNCGDWTR